MRRRPRDCGHGFDLDEEFRPESRQLHLVVKYNSNAVGEAHIWLAPAHLKTFADAGLADIEWIEIAKSHRRQGLGLALLSECFRAARRYGARSFMLWAEDDSEWNNLAMRRLAEKAGFSKGPAMHWATYTIA